MRTTNADRIPRDANRLPTFIPRLPTAPVKNRLADPPNVSRDAILGHDEVADLQRLDRHLSARRKDSRAGEKALVGGVMRVIVFVRMMIRRRLRPRRRPPPPVPLPTRTMSGTGRQSLACRPGTQCRQYSGGSNETSAREFGAGPFLIGNGVGRLRHGSLLRNTEGDPKLPPHWLTRCFPNPVTLTTH